MSRLSRPHLTSAPGPRAVGAGYNWPLLLGSLIVLAALVVALAGPALAPRHPLRESFIGRNREGIWIKPPYPPLTVRNFPLGSDEFGRDLYSQLLWAVRPTLILVLVAATLRLVLGLALGLASGWVEGRAARVLDVTISTALAVPVMFVALCVVVLMDKDWGIWAFIVGLIITGWAESARLLRARVRSLKPEPYIEAARALGASELQVIDRHVLPQVMPLVWITLAFEVSATLLTVATLGVLGYFMHSIWLPLEDWTAIRASGWPELGQMLATAFAARERPWGLLVAGSAVFVIVLGFNLLGEGLRQSLSPEALRRQPDPASLRGKLAGWVEAQRLDSLADWRRSVSLIGAMGAMLGLVGGGSLALWRLSTQQYNLADLPVPGGHLWGSVQGNPYGTRRTEMQTLRGANLVWRFDEPKGFTGGPVVAADGTLYIITAGRELLAVSPRGLKLRRVPLPVPAIGTPALTASGDLIVVDELGGVSAITPMGELLWHLPGDELPVLASPIVGVDGTIYYPTDGKMIAVLPDGRLKWKVNLPVYSYIWPAVSLSGDEQYLLFEDVVMDARTGAPLTQRTTEFMDRYFVGADGELYLGGPNELLMWHPTDFGAEVFQRARFDSQALALGFRLLQAGGVTPEGRLWLLFNSEFERPRMLWFELDGQLREDANYPYFNAWFAGMDARSTAYLCGALQDSLECRAMPAEEDVPLWSVRLARGDIIRGTALVPNRLYVSTGNGYLYAIGPRTD